MVNAALMFGVAGPARADATLVGPETISGRVTDVQGNGLSDVWVSASNLSGPDGPGGSANVDANGRYTLTGLVPGDYRIWFTQGPSATPGVAATDDLVPLYYGQKTPSDPWTLVAVSAGQTVTGIDMQLHEGGGISGTVTDDQGNPVADVAAFVEGAGAWTTTDAAGHYVLSFLEPRNYTVYFEPPDATDYFPQNFGGAALPPSNFGGPPSDSSGYTPVTVAAGATTGGIDVRLHRGGAITGTVTDQHGHPLAGISVNLAAPGAGPVPPGRAGEVTTDAAGGYRLGRLLPGAYRVSFAGEGFAGQLYGAAQSEDAASPVDVPAGVVVSGIDAQMQLAGSISGSVVDPGGQRVNAFVDAYNPDGTIASLGGANSGGFTINDLTPGSYLLYATALDAPLVGFYTDPLG
ncbi:MAG TPA: carboxypeptidase regulatory-like domain-containing protein, partial [Solirubrobacteraceae bacterium]|nr:carboxypeptidase regulatory-like domain-containing protein [Solirubrobacteraceae bacterium]